MAKNTINATADVQLKIGKVNVAEANKQMAALVSSIGAPEISQTLNPQVLLDTSGYKRVVKEIEAKNKSLTTAMTGLGKKGTVKSGSYKGLTKSELQLLRNYYQTIGSAHKALRTGLTQSVIKGREVSARLLKGTLSKEEFFSKPELQRQVKQYLAFLRSNVSKINTAKKNFQNQINQAPKKQRSILESLFPEILTGKSSQDLAVVNGQLAKISGIVAKVQEQRAKLRAIKTDPLYRSGNVSLGKVGGLAGVSRIPQGELPGVNKALEGRLVRLQNLTGRVRVKLDDLSNAGLRNSKAFRTNAARLKSYQGALVQTNKALVTTKDKLQGVHSAASESGRTIRQFFRYALGYGALYKMLGAVTALVTGLTDLQDRLVSIRAITGASAEEMRQVSAAIKTIAVETPFDVAEIATAAQTLSQAGVKPADISSALASVARFASATNSTLETSSDLISTMRNVYKDLSDPQIADQLTKAVNISKLTSEDLKTILSRGLQVAKTFNIGSDQYLAAVAVLRNAGIKASTVSTGLRETTLELLAPDTKTIKALKLRYSQLGEDLSDAAIKARFAGFSHQDNPLASVLGELKRLGADGSGKSVFDRVFSVRAANVIPALLANLDSLEGNLASLNTPGAALEGSAIQMDGFSKSAKNLGAAILNLADTISGDLVDSLAQGLQGLTQFVRGVETGLVSVGAAGGDTGSGLAAGAAAGFVVATKSNGNLFQRVLKGGAAGVAVGSGVTSAQIAVPQASQAISNMVTFMGYMVALVPALSLIKKLPGLLKISKTAAGVAGGFQKLAKGASYLGVLGKGLKFIATRVNPYVLAISTALAIWSALSDRGGDLQKRLEKQKQLVVTAEKELEDRLGELSQYDPNIEGSQAFNFTQQLGILNRFKSNLATALGITPDQLAEVYDEIIDSVNSLGGEFVDLQSVGAAKQKAAIQVQLAALGITDQLSATALRNISDLASKQQGAETQIEQTYQESLDYVSKISDVSKLTGVQLVRYTAIMDNLLTVLPSDSIEDKIAGLQNVQNTLANTSSESQLQASLDAQKIEHALDIEVYSSLSETERNLYQQELLKKVRAGGRATAAGLKSLQAELAAQIAETGSRRLQAEQEIAHRSGRARRVHTNMLKGLETLFGTLTAQATAVTNAISLQAQQVLQANQKVVQSTHTLLESARSFQGTEGSGDIDRVLKLIDDKTENFIGPQRAGGILTANDSTTGERTLNALAIELKNAVTARTKAENQKINQPPPKPTGGGGSSTSLSRQYVASKELKAEIIRITEGLADAKLARDFSKILELFKAKQAVQLAQLQHEIEFTNSELQGSTGAGRARLIKKAEDLDLKLLDLKSKQRIALDKAVRDNLSSKLKRANDNLVVTINELNAELDALNPNDNNYAEEYSKISERLVEVERAKLGNAQEQLEVQGQDTEAKKRQLVLDLEQVTIQAAINKSAAAIAQIEQRIEQAAKETHDEARRSVSNRPDTDAQIALSLREDIGNLEDLVGQLSVDSNSLQGDALKEYQDKLVDARLELVKLYEQSRLTGRSLSDMVVEGHDLSLLSAKFQDLARNSASLSDQISDNLVKALTDVGDAIADAIVDGEDLTSTLQNIIYETARANAKAQIKALYNQAVDKVFGFFGASSPGAAGDEASSKMNLAGDKMLQAATKMSNGLSGQGPSGLLDLLTESQGKSGKTGKAGEEVVKTVEGGFNTLFSRGGGVFSTIRNMFSSLFSKGSSLFSTVGGFFSGILSSLGNGGGAGGSGSTLGAIVSLGSKFFGGFSKGGVVEGKGTGTSDSIPAIVTDNGTLAGTLLVSNKEAILNAEAVKVLGEGGVNKINSEAMAGTLNAALLDSGNISTAAPVVVPSPTVDANTTVVNVVDQNLAKNFLESSEASRVIINHINQNASAIKQVLQ